LAKRLTFGVFAREDGIADVTQVAQSKASQETKIQWDFRGLRRCVRVAIRFDREFERIMKS